jgi:hypothetical protein
MRWVAGGAALVLVALALVLHRTNGVRQDEREEQGEVLALAEPEREQSSPVDLAGTLEPAPADDLVAGEEARPSALDESAAHAESSRPEVAPFLHGTVVVRDALGRERREEDGRFVLLLWTRAGARGVTVDVRSGAWSIPATEVPGSIEAVSVQGLELGRRPTVGEHAPEARLPLPVDGRLDLSARWPPRLTLHVRGSEGPLAHILVFEPSDRTATELPHPGEIPWQPDSRRSSPLLLDAPSGRARVVYVGADDHAWTRVEVLAEEAERVLVLEPGGDLRVRVESAERDPGASLRIFSAGSASPIPLSEVPLGTRGVVVLEGLPTGVLVAAAHLGDRWDPHVLGSVEARIRAGEKSEVTLVLAEVEAATWVTAEGTLTLPPAWELDAFHLVLGLQEAPRAGWSGQVDLTNDSMERVNRAAGLYRWSANVQPGSYSAFVPETGWFTALEIGPTGAQDVHLEVAPPCQLRVRCVEDASGAEAEVDGLDWAYVRDSTLLPASEHFQRDAATGAWEVRAAIGTLLVRAFRDGEIVQQHVAAAEGLNELTLRLPRITGLRVVLVDGDAGVAWGERHPALRPLEGQAAPVPRRPAGNRALLRASEPGGYVLVLPEIPGYEPVPEARVQLLPDTIGEHVVRLRRRP